MVWCPKYRRKVLLSAVDLRLKAITTEVCAEREAEILALEVMAANVHLLLDCHEPPPAKV